MSLPVQFSHIHDITEETHGSPFDLGKKNNTKEKKKTLSSEEINLVKRTLFQCDTVSAGTYFPACY